MKTTKKTFEIRYEFLDFLPQKLFHPTVTHIHGDLISRGKTIIKLRKSLLSGKIPDEDSLDWPEESFRKPLISALKNSDIAIYCNSYPKLTDDILLYILNSVEESQRFYERALMAFEALANKDQVEWVTLSPLQKLKKEIEDGRSFSVEVKSLFNSLDWEKLRSDSMKLAAQFSREVIESKWKKEWSEKTDIFKEFKDVLDELSKCTGLPPSRTSGFLRSLPYHNILQMRSIFGNVKVFKQLITDIGRMKESDDPTAPTVFERIGKCVERNVERTFEIESDSGPEVRGIERSGEISRMLPSESILLIRPVLRKLWYSRWSERMLLTYHAPRVLTQRMQAKQTYEDGEEIQQQRANRGPIIVILDTSGSMAGQRETVAKAIVLQMVSVAFMENRKAYVYNFSGDGDLTEKELSFDGEGFTEILAFLSVSYRGGTVPDEALRRACQRLDQEKWRQSDIVIVSDGEFNIAPETRATIDQTKRKSHARIHGISVGIRDGFAELECDFYHNLYRWCSVDIPL